MAWKEVAPTIARSWFHLLPGDRLDATFRGYDAQKVRGKEEKNILLDVLALTRGTKEVKPAGAEGKGNGQITHPPRVRLLARLADGGVAVGDRVLIERLPDATFPGASGKPEPVEDYRVCVWIPDGESDVAFIAAAQEEAKARAALPHDAPKPADGPETAKAKEQIRGALERNADKRDAAAEKDAAHKAKTAEIVAAKKAGAK